MMDRKTIKRLKAMGFRWHLAGRERAGWRALLDEWAARRPVAALGEWCGAFADPPEFDLPEPDWRARWPISGEPVAAGAGTVATACAADGPAPAAQLADLAKLKPAEPRADCIVLYHSSWKLLKAAAPNPGLAEVTSAGFLTWAGMPVYWVASDKEFGDTVCELIEAGQRVMTLDQDAERWKAAEPDRYRAVLLYDAFKRQGLFGGKSAIRNPQSAIE